MSQTSPPTGQGAQTASTLRSRLLWGLGLAVAVPFLAFFFVGDALLRSSTKENLGRHLLVNVAQDTSNRIGSWLSQVRGQAAMAAASSEVRAAFAGTPEPLRELDGWYLRNSDFLGSLGDLLLVSTDGEILFQTRGGEPVPDGRGRRLTGEPWATWLVAAGGDQLRFHSPVPDPLAASPTISATRDPASYVLPLVLAMRDDTQAPVGTCVFLLAFSRVQHEIEQTHRMFTHDIDIASGEAFLVDRRSGRHLLHSDRNRIGSEAPYRNVEGFAEEADGRVLAAAAIDAPPSLQWSAGVAADGAELFRSVGRLGVAFLVLVLLVLGATLGIAMLISVAATRSLGRLEAVTEALGAGRLDARAEVAGPREVRKLAGALNAMAAQLEAERERLKTAERDRAWTAMARQVAHEIKNPLQPVRLHAELITRACRKSALEDADRERAIASAGVILRQVEALQRIVADFSAFAEASLPLKEKERFRASQVLGELVQLYAVGSADGAVVEFVDESGRAELFGSALRLQQVLVNLIKNAIEAGPAPARVEVSAGVEGDRWVVEVRDRGPGLPEGAAAKVFVPSFSTKPGGTGLGLAICQRNIDAMGGTIDLRARPGGGLCARIDLPLAGG